MHTSLRSDFVGAFKCINQGNIEELVTMGTPTGGGSLWSGGRVGVGRRGSRPSTFACGDCFLPKFMVGLE